MNFSGSIVQLVPLGLEEAQARIRELEMHWLELRDSEIRLEGRIAKAKAILKHAIGTRHEGMSFGVAKDIHDALDALEGR